MKKCIVVLGMHRSGTSAITRGLKVLGVELGDRLIAPIANNNMRGFWEDIEINRLNTEMLHAMDSDWHHLAPIQFHDIEILHKKGYLFRARDLLLQKINNTNVWGFKDPRVAKLLPFWKEVFSLCQIDVHYILTIRNPLSVAQSLSKRDSFDKEKSYLLWLGHIIISLSGTVGKNTIIIDYDRLMQSPDFELRRIAKQFDLKVDPIEMQNYITEFLDKELRHYVYDINDLLLDDLCPPIVREIYTELLEDASDKKSINNPSILNKIDIWIDEFERLKAPLTLIDRIFIKNNAFTTLNDRLSEKNNALTALNERLFEKNNALTETIAKLNQIIIERDNIIRQILASTSWQITAPLRFVKQTLWDLAKKIKRPVSSC